MDPRLDIAVAPALLAVTDPSSSPAWLRMYRPAPTVAFGRLDTVSRGWEDAVRIAISAGFTPVVRAPGGRAVAYHDDCICVDLIVPSANPRAGIAGRFEQVGELFVSALREIGIPASIGPVPGECCPGRHSVSASGRVKLVGTAQRVTRYGSITSAVLVVRRPAPIRSVIAGVYARLGLKFDPVSLGAVADMAPGVRAGDLVQLLKRHFSCTSSNTGRADRGDLLIMARAWAGKHPDPCAAIQLEVAQADARLVQTSKMAGVR